MGYLALSLGGKRTSSRMSVVVVVMQALASRVSAEEEGRKKGWSRHVHRRRRANSECKRSYESDEERNENP